MRTCYPIETGCSLLNGVTTTYRCGPAASRKAEHPVSTSVAALLHVIVQLRASTLQRYCTSSCSCEHRPCNATHNRTDGERVQYKIIAAEASSCYAHMRIHDDGRLVTSLKAYRAPEKARAGADRVCVSSAGTSVAVGAQSSRII